MILRRVTALRAGVLGVGIITVAIMGVPAFGLTGAGAQEGSPMRRAPGRIAPTTRAGAVTLEQVEEDLAWLINQRRAEAGLAPLLVAPAVRAPARRWAEAQAADGTISHRDDLSPYPNAVPGLAWSLAGENVGHAGSALTNGPSVMTSLDQAFYDSPTHRDNVLGAYTHLAVGATDDGENLYVTIAFVDWFGAAVEGQYLPASALHDTTGAVDSVVGTEGGVRLVGWVADPDGEPSVEVTVDGRARTVAPSEARPDLSVVPGAAPGLVNGLNTLIAAPPGPAEVCTEGPAVGFGAGASFGCVDVVIPLGWDGLVGTGDEATVVAYRADGLLPRGDAQPTSADPLKRRAWRALFPGTVQRYRAGAGNTDRSIVFGDALGRVHWRGAGGAEHVAAPPDGELAPGRPSVDIGDLDGDGADELVMLVRSGTGWAMTGFAGADPAEPMRLLQRPDLDGWTSVRVSVLPGPAPAATPAPGPEGEGIVERTVVTGYRPGGGPLVASIGGADATEVAPADTTAGATSDVEWVDLGGDGPDAVVVDRTAGTDSSRVRLFPSSDRYRRPSQSATVAGHPVDLEPR